MYIGAKHPKGYKDTDIHFMLIIQHSPAVCNEKKQGLNNINFLFVFCRGEKSRAKNSSDKCVVIDLFVKIL